MLGNSDFFTDHQQDINQGIQELGIPEGELHLRFHVPSGNEFVMPATGIKEIMQHSPERITPIPNVSPLLLGTINLRGQIIWVADLGQFLGDKVPLNTERTEISIIAIEDQDTLLGLAVEDLGATRWLLPKNLQPSQNLSDEMAPFVPGEWVINEDPRQVLKLLDHTAILKSARWAV